jgi:hypothetical protein
MTITSSPPAADWLPPIPGLHRRDPEHRYHLHDQPFPVSVTGVLAVSKSDYAMARMEATRPVWEPRGNTCHRALELFLRLPNQGSGDLTVAMDRSVLQELGELLSGDYAEWVRPLITHERWQTITVIASERPTCCPHRGLAGTYDVGFLDPSLPPSPARPRGVEGPARVLADLKSLGENGSTYSTAPQLGGYMACDWSHGIWWDWGQTIWARPGQTTWSPLYSVSDCRVSWAAAWAHYRALPLNRPIRLA